MHQIKGSTLRRSFRAKHPQYRQCHPIHPWIAAMKRRLEKSIQVALNFSILVLRIKQDVKKRWLLNTSYKSFTKVSVLTFTGHRSLIFHLCGQRSFQGECSNSQASCAAITVNMTQDQKVTKRASFNLLMKDRAKAAIGSKDNTNIKPSKRLNEVWHSY